MLGSTSVCRFSLYALLVLLFLALQGATAASSLHVPRSKRGLSIPLTARNVQAASDGDLWARHAFHAQRRRSVWTGSRRETTSATLKGRDAYFTGPLEIGSQHFEMLFDTGSHKIVMDPSAYSPGPTAKNLDFTTTVGFGGGGALPAMVYNDTVQFAGISLEGVSLAAASEGKPGDIVAANVGQGVLGLNFHAEFPGQPPGVYTTGVLEELSAQKGIKGFVLDLDDAGGTLSLDDSGQDVPGMTYLPAGRFRNTDEWLVTVGLNGIPLSVLVDLGGGPDTFISTESIRQLARDLKVPLVDDLYDDGSLAMVDECGAVVDLELEFGSAKIPLPQNLLWDKITDGPYKGKCNLRFYGIPEEDYPGIGSLLFKLAVVAFDYSGHRVGVAPK